MEKNKAKSLTWAVVAAYDGPYGAKGTVVSCHRSYEAAAKAARDNNWLAIVEL